MISNERRWPSHIQSQRQPYREPPVPRQPRPFIQEDTIKSEGLQIERKHFLVMLKENSRGRFLRIAEEANGKSTSIIIPASGLRGFQKLLEEMVNADSGIPAKNQPPQR